MRLLPLSLVAVAACGGRTGPTGGPDLDPGGGSGAKPAQNLPAALIQATEGKPLFIDDFTSMMLFADERLAAQQIIAEWASANGLTIVPPATVEDAIDKANRGLNPETGAACGPSLERELAIERWVHAAGRVKAAVYCEQDCKLQLEIKLDAKGTEFYAGPYDSGKPWRDELRVRLGGVVDNGGHERYGHANNPVEVAGVARGTDDLLPDDADVLELGVDGAAIATQCGLTGLAAAVLVDPGTGGRARCERSGDRTYIAETSPTIMACVCEKVLARGAPTRRQIIRIAAPTSSMDPVKTASGLVASAQLIGGNEYRTFGVAWFAPGQLDLYVSRCFAGRTVAEEKEVNATIDFDADGRAARATIADVNGLLKPDEHACLQTAIKALRTPCPEQGNMTGTARISWRIHAPD